jgi:ubiquinol-cytochrome c reductase cytochrome c subunit
VLDRGRQLYGSGCAGCHGQAGQGSTAGPPLLGVGAASVDFQLSTGRMPLSRVVKQPSHGAPAYGRSDTEALVRYVSSLAPGGEPVPTLGVGDAASGRQLYLENCAACHSSTGVGAALPAGYIAPSLLQTDRTRVAEAVRVGPGLMPPFPASVLDDGQLADLVAYVQALSAEGSHGGWAIGSLGPVSEGLFGWVAGLGALLVVIRLLGKRAP